MKNVIDLLFRQENEIGDIMFDESEIFVAGEMSNICGVTGDQIVDGNDAVIFCQQSIDQMRSQKTGTASHDRNGMGIFSGHSAVVLMVTAEVCQQEVTANDDGENACPTLPVIRKFDI